LDEDISHYELVSWVLHMLLVSKPDNRSVETHGNPHYIGRSIQVLQTALHGSAPAPVN